MPLNPTPPVFSDNIGDAKILSSASSVKIIKLSKNDTLTVFDAIYVTKKIVSKSELCKFLLDETTIVLSTVVY